MHGQRAHAEKKHTFSICSPLLLLSSFFFAVRLSLSMNVTVAFFSCRRRRRPILSLLLSAPNQTRNTKLTTPSAVRVSRLARWSNWNTPSPREPVQRSSVGV